MNKEYVLEKLAQEYSLVEQGLLEPEVPLRGAIRSGFSGFLFGGLLGSLTTPYDAMKAAKMEKEAISNAALKRFTIGSALGAGAFGLLGYIATKDANKMKEKNPDKFLVNYGRNLIKYR